MKLNWSKEKTEKCFILFGKVMLVAIILLNAWMTHKYYFNFINSDDASELVYARLLAREGKIISSTWKGSTEIEILNNQLVYYLLFHFTSNFQVVRIVGQMILSGIFLGCYYFCLRGIDSEKASARFWKSAFLLLIPVSRAWLFLAMKAYYIPAVSVCFVTLGLALRICKKEKSVKSKWMLVIAGSVLAFVSSLEGLRHLELTYAPLLVAFFWIWWNQQERKKWNHLLDIPMGALSALIWSAAAFGGYLVNILILSKTYIYDTDRAMKFPEVFTAENFQNIFNAILTVTGYAGEKDLVSLGGICNALSIVLVGTIIYVLIRLAVKMKNLEQEEQLLPAFVIATFSVSLFLFIAIDMVEARWIMCSTVPVFLLLALLDKFPIKKQYICLTCIYIVIGMLGMREYHTIASSTTNEGLRSVYDLLTDSDYTFGYSTFKSGNLMTELTNGKMDMRIVQAYGPNHKLKNRNWLTPVTFEYHEGEFPLILEKERTEGLFDPQEDWKLILDTEEYWVYEIPDQKVFQEYLDKVEL